MAPALATQRWAARAPAAGRLFAQLAEAATWPPGPRRLREGGARRRAAARAAASIDVLDLSLPGAADRLDASFRATGFAVVTGHGVDYGALRQLRLKALEFFRSPLEHKQLFDKAGGEHKGARARGMHSRLLEGGRAVNFWRARGGLPRLDAGAPTDAGEAAPEPVPECVPGFREAAEGAQRAMHDFRLRLDGLVCESLGADPVAFPSKLDPFRAGMRLAYYPAQVTPPAPGQLRYGAHVDSGGMTVLVRDEAAQWGTQVQLHDGEWVDVPLVEESIVLNVGALLSRWTNGRWRASVHRVGNDAAERLSIVGHSVVFKADAEVEPLPSCVSPESPSRYAPIKAGDFLTERVRLHRDNYAEERGYSRAAAEQALSEQIRDYQM
ncbi:unnamed protein product [Prorocentrum cordatum]|uniref:Fe2OG dioxygenase domain-containing protein n=1 Tax=Prorocentrum cordatum TaxID=2364126 RepID=A0ABN9RWL8_9DINO|nr:unnamed protein product [Polarella glacialis]